ncbi:Beta-glucanase, GH16 family [Formosa sp. Hel1_31_208]|uniref:glycoside hydrolase family 16 protein n=1 Tax=Formosa sp. Hel1_31_208 TaxID=1798225 RepID=UPI00087B461D|nr:glycoside hydrolase family 16 protein [Formosa sp. Hel1_31_208]SDS23776.1 Beta-glucanase, GH16 family [Formosa sp. Hel1_31_208]
MNFKYKNLKTGVLQIMCICAVLVLTNCNTDETQEVAQLTNLVWQDEFNVDGPLDQTRWTYDLGDGTAQGLPAGWGNNELQYYTDRPENANVENGVLVITADEESFMGSNYTSARITTQGLFEQQYGRFEARIRLPVGKGIWPAFWLLGNDCDENPWPQCGEIDIMEYLGNAPTVVLGSVHGPGYNAGDSISREYTLENDRFDEGFHIFGIEWGPNYINYYVDGDLYQTITPETTADEAITFNAPDNAGEWVFNRPFYIIINMAVGGSLPGAPNAETEFPQSMYVDYVRVYN